jgi:hypothetical protein
MSFTLEEHAEFQASLPRSDIEVEFVATWLRSRGNTVIVKKHGVAPTPDLWAEYSDNGDLEFTTKNGQHFLGEVKGSSRCFADGWPFRTYIVCQKAQHDRKDPEPDFYFTTSHDHQAIASTACCHRADWTVKPIKNPITGQMKDTYLTPIRHVRLFDLRF